MPDSDVGIMTFDKGIQVDQWEALRRNDIAEKSAHVAYAGLSRMELRQGKRV
jgi:hypothetical protein